MGYTAGMISRRNFLRAGAAVTASVVALPAERSQAVVGTQLYGWGQYYERDGKKLYEHLDEVFSAVRDAGYDYAEGFLDVADPEGNGRFASRCKTKGLRPVAIYTGGRFHQDAEKTIERTVAAAKICAKEGYSVINCNPDPIGRGKTDAELKTQANALNELGSQLAAFGLKLAIHNHTPEMENGGREFRHNFTATQPQHVGFCYDVHWVYRGGVQPKEALAEFGKRIASWHMRQSRDGIWWEDLAAGDVDYPAIAAFAREHRLPEIYTVELALEKGTKITRSVVENHRRSRDYIKRVFEV